MAKFEVLLVVVAIMQYGSCNVRDQRHVSAKLDFFTKVLLMTSNEVEHIDPKIKADKELLVLIADGFIKEGTTCVGHINRAVSGNTLDNEGGKALGQFLELTGGYVQWLNANLQKDNVQLHPNMKAGLSNFLAFVPMMNNSIAKAKQSTKNSELAINSLMDSIDTAIYLFVKLNTHFDNKKSGNNELGNKFKQAVSGALTSLNKLAPNSYNTNELVVLSRQLKLRIHGYLSSLKELEKNPEVAGEFKAATERSIKKLEKIESEIASKVNSDLSFSALKQLYKSWLNEIYNTAADLFNSSKAQIHKLRMIILDAMGTARYFKTEFDIMRDGVSQN